MISERNTIVKIDCRTDGRGSISIVAESKIDKIIAEIFDEGKSIQSVELIEATGIDTLWFAIREPKLWSPSSPFLYDVTLKLFSGDDIEVIHEKFGVRTISTNQDNILLNDKPFYVRGYIRGIKAHDHADTCNLGEEEYYRKNILQAKKYGFNFIRFHSTIPTKTFFKVADELGILVHIEFREDIDEYNNLEEMVHDTEKLISPTYVKGIIEDLYNHPSLAVYCIGNEIKGNKVSDTIQQIRKKIKENDTSRPFLDSCAWGMNGRKWVDIDVQHMSYYFPFAKHADMYENTENLLVAGDADGNALLEEGINSSIARELFFNVPLLAHEVCHYTALRDYKTLNEKYEKYGTQKPWWVEESLKMIEAKGLADIYDEMYRASKLFQHECWKIAFEAMRRSKLLGGFHFLQFTDTDAYENSNGMVDCFDDECFISPKQVLDFNGDRVLLADVGSRIAYSGDELHIPVMLSNYAETNDKKATFNYSLVDGEGEVFASGEMKNLNISKNGLYRICAITVKLPEISSRKLMLKVKLTSDLGVVTANEWSIWVYRKEISVNYNTFCNYERGNVVVTDDIEKALVKLDEGKNVCLVYRQDYTRHIIHQDMDAPKYSLKATWNRFKPVIWDRGTNYGGLCNDKLLNKYSGNYGFVGKELTATGVIKNIGFTNVVHTDGCASMLVMTDAGTLQNIYIDYAATGTNSRTMTITSANVVVDNVFVNGYDAPKIEITGESTMHLLCSDQWVDNSYSLDIMGFAPAGVDNMGRYCNWKATGDVYKDRLFASPAALAANATAVANLTAWANESKYWHFDATTGEVTFGNIEEPAAPDGHTHIYDQTVVKYKYFKADPICTSAVYYMSCECGAVNKNVAATFEVGDGNGHTVVIQPAVPADCVNAGKTEGSYCSTCGEVIVAQTDIPSVGAHHFVLASDDKYTTAQCTGCEMAGTPYRASATHINVGAIFNSTWSTDGTQTTYVDLSAQLPADFGYVTSMKNSGVSGADFCDTSFKMDRGLRLKQYDYLANIPGVQEFTVTGSNGGTTTVTLTVVTKVVHNEADYAAVPAIITKLSGGGYFELGNDIVSATGSITLVPLTTTNKFSGTFDGCGYVIDGLTGFSGNYGFVGKELTATGVIKNIGFTNVVHTDGCASMLVMTDAGTLQNIYIDYAATGTNSRTMTITSANVVVDNVFVNGYDAPKIEITGESTMHLLCSDQWVDNSYSLDIMGFAPAGVDNMGRYCNWKATGDVYKDRLFASPAALAANATAVANLTAWANESKYWHFDPTTGVLLFGNTATEGHEYSSEYTFDADSHYRQCTTCGARAYSSAHIYDQEIEKQDYLKTEATCTEGTTYYKSCVCGACDKSESAATFSDGNALGHIIITTPRVEPKCEEAGATSSSKCSGCGQVIKESVEIPATGHDYGALLSVEHYALDCSNGCGTTYYVGNGYINFGMNFDDVNTAWSNDATRTTALDLSSTGVASVESIKLTHNGTTYEIYGGSQLKKGLVVINIGALPYAQIYGDYELSINNGEATKTVTFVTKLIHNAEDYTNVVKAMTRLGNGYYALGCDIEPKVIGGNIEVAPIPANFAGTFDGLGYTIDGLRATQGDNNSAFVKSMTATGVIKNLGLTNVDIASTASDCKFFGQTSAGTYQNIYVSFDSIAASYRFIVAMASDVVVDNIFVDYTNVTDYQNSFTLYALGDMRNNGLTSASKIYGIGGGIIPSWQVRVTEVADHFVAGTWADLKNNTTVWNAVNAFVTEAPEYWTVDSTTGEVNFGRQGLGFKDGETDYTLVYDSSNDKIGLAGDFVFENIRSATGATMAKNNSTPAWSASSKYIVIGNTELAAAAGVTLDTNYAYQITVKDNSIFILADSEWNYQLAVIKFLEEFLGYKYFDKDLTIYEKDNGSGEWYLPTADIYGEPASVELRKEPSLWDLSKEIYYGMGMTHTSEIFIPMRDENGNDVVVGPNGNATSHTSFYFIDPETYLNEHPNYFSTNEIDYSSGTGVSVSSTATQLCYTAHGNAADLAEMQEIVANKIVERALWYYDDGVRNTIVFGAQDKNIRCNCGTCADVVEQYGSLSAANISFTNAVARLVKQKLIDQGRADRAEELTILFLAYQHASTPPNESFTEKFEDNVGVLIASSKTNYSWTFEDEINANNKAEIEGWSKICNQIYYWIYNHNDHDFLAPSNIFETTKANIEFLKENNAKMIYIQSANVNLYNSGFSSFKTYLEAQLLVDVTKSYDDIKSDYFKYYYGEGGSMMEQFFDEVVEYMNSQRDAGVEDFYGKVVNQKCNDPKYWSLAQLEGWMTLCDEALAALDTSDPNYEVYKRHIEIEQIFPRYMLARYGDGNSSYYNYYSNYSGFQTTTTNWFGITSSKFDSEKLKAFRQEFVNDCMRLCITSVYSADSDGTPGTLKHVAEMGNWGVTPDTGWPEK